MAHTSFISSIYKPEGDNTGGYKQLLFRPKRDIQDIPMPDEHYNIVDDITFAGGVTGFFEMYLTLYSTNVTIEQSQTPQGPIVDVKITGIVPGDSNINQGMFNYMMYERFILVGKDNEKVQRIFGTLENGMRFTWDYDTEEQPDGRRGYRISFTGQFAFAPYFYKSDVPVQVTGFDLVEVNDGNELIKLTSGQSYTCKNTLVDASFSLSKSQVTAYTGTLDISYQGDSLFNQVWRYYFSKEFKYQNKRITAQAEKKDPSNLYFTVRGFQNIELNTYNASNLDFSGIEVKKDAVEVLPPWPTGDHELALVGGEGLTTNGRFVSAWKDQAKSNDAAQSMAANQPRLYNTRNGVSAPYFDYQDDYLIISHSKDIDFDSDDPFTVVALMTSHSKKRGIFARFDRGGSIEPIHRLFAGRFNHDDIFLQYRDIDSNRLDVIFNKHLGQPDDNQKNWVYEILQMVAVTYNGSRNASGVKAYHTSYPSAVDGLKENTDVTIDRDNLNSSTLSALDMIVGDVRNTSLPGNPHSREIPELHMYRRELSFAELQQFADYFKKKYNLPY